MRKNVGSRSRKMERATTSLAAQNETHGGKPSFIVGIGASAGGLEALERLFRAMPSDSGMAFVIIQHLSPDFISLMDELLARFTTMAICRVDQPVEMKANTIYLLPPRKEMLVSGEKLVTHARPTDHSLNMPINVFFRSLAREIRDRAIAIVLSGTGTDGSLGLMDVRDMGGFVLVQSEETAKFDGMPRSAIDTGLADAVMAPEEMPEALIAYAKNPDTAFVNPQLRRTGEDAAAGLPIAFQKLHEAYDIDFSFYKPATISRRLERRISLNSCRELKDYLLLLDNPLELEGLFKDLLIGVTRFFRDDEAFESLRTKVIGPLLDATPAGEEIRVWVPGCASGEEAYSLGILFLEAFDERKREANLKIFATDVHRDSLAIASEGVYSASSLECVSQERRERFFHEEGTRSYRVHSRLRKLLVFSLHNLIKDPPFTRMDVVSCRNLLIYFLPATQQRVVSAFHFALKRKGVLFLGPSEGPAELHGEFETLDRSWKIYRKENDSRRPLDLHLSRTINQTRAEPRGSAAIFGGDMRLARTYDALLHRFVPTGVLINERREVLHFFGDADRFLRPQPGRVGNDVLMLARGELRIALASAIQGAIKRSDKVVFKGVRFKTANGEVAVDLTADPIVDKINGAKFLLLLFQQEKPLPGLAESRGQSFAVGEEANARIQQLENELQYTRESLQSAAEELQTSNEELQATNEELQASNEELQSTNEELHSVNEELYTVNSELEQKNRALIETSNDLKNLVNASEVGTIFLDTNHRVRMFTPMSATVLNLLDQDVGRDIKHITSRIKDDDVLDCIEKAAQTRQSSVKRIQTPEGRSFLRRITPYLDGDKRTIGLILTFFEVTALDAAERLFSLTFEGAPAAIILVSPTGSVNLVNPRAEAMFGYKKGEMVGLSLEALVPERFRRRHHTHRSEFAASERARGMGEKLDLFGLRRDGSEFPVEIGLSPIAVGADRCVMAFVTDITERIRMQSEHKRIEQKLQETAKLESLGVLAGGIAHDFNNILAGIVGNVDLLEEDLPRGATLRNFCHSIRSASLRASELCKQMLTYAGRGKLVMARTDLVSLVKDTLQLIKASVSKAATVEFTSERDSLSIKMDAAQIRQVTMNLVINAAEALAGSSGLIRIRLGVTRGGPQESATVKISPPDLAAEFAFLEVADSGIGISPENLDRIFDPFFTTKTAGRGLGLAAVRGIIRGHRGGLELSSEIGRGTVFRVFLPLEGGEGKPDATREAGITSHPPELELAEESWRGTGAVLVADDEEPVRLAVAQTLERLGFETVLAGDGRQVIEKFLEAPLRFSFIVLDLTMPELDGIAAISELQKINPEIKILLISGYAEKDAGAQLAAGKVAGFLQKPFTNSTLRRMVRRIVEKSR